MKTKISSLDFGVLALGITGVLRGEEGISETPFRPETVH